MFGSKYINIVYAYLIAILNDRVNIIYMLVVK